MVSLDVSRKISHCVRNDNRGAFETPKGVHFVMTIEERAGDMISPIKRVTLAPTLAFVGSPDPTWLGDGRDTICSRMIW